MDTLIVSGGTIDRDFAADYIGGRRFDLVIAADRGIDFCREAGMTPDLILGDFDSADSAALRYFTDHVPGRIRRYPAKKDETDTEIALAEAIRAGSGDIAILGATGTRLDHVLGNIQILRRALIAGVSCCLVDAHNRIRLLRGDFALRKEEQFGTYVSLIPFTETVRIRALRGFVYNVENYELRSGIAVGVSNEIAEDTAKICVDEGILVLIESRD